MSPIFVRPVREQLEHDRLIRHLLIKYKKKLEVATNVGDEQVAPVKLGTATFFPDLVLTDGKKLAGLVEVETGESVNNLETMAQWVHFSRARAPFHLYVPMHMYDAARRLCEAYHVNVAEFWTYRSMNDAFDLVRMSAEPAASGSRGSAPKAAKAAAKPASKAAPKSEPAAKPAPSSKPVAKAKVTKPAKSAPARAGAKRKPAPAKGRKAVGARKR